MSGLQLDAANFSSELYNTHTHTHTTHTCKHTHCTHLADTQRALSILESILAQLDPSDLRTLAPEPGQVVNGAVGEGEPCSNDDNLEEDMIRIQSAVDTIRSPLFATLVDIRLHQEKVREYDCVVCTGLKVHMRERERERESNIPYTIYGIYPKI